MANRNNISLEATIDAQSAVNELNKALDAGVGAISDYADQIQKIFGRKITFTPEVRFDVDADGFVKPVAYLKESGNVLKDIYQKQEQLNRVQKGSVTNLKQSIAYWTQQRNEAVRVITKVDEYGRKVKQTNPEWAEANNKVRQLSKQLEVASASNFWQKIKADFNLGPIINAGKGLNEIVNVFQSVSIVVGQLVGQFNTLANALNSVQQIKLLFEGIGAGPAEVAQVFSESSRIALQYGVNLQSVRDSFAQLTPVITASGGTLTNVSQITEALASRFATFGLSADKSARVMNGVIQAFGKGKLMAEELTQQISEADPAFKTDLAGAMGVTIAKLNEMVKAGDVTTDKLIEFLPLLAKNSIFFQNLGTSATSAVAALGRGTATVEQVKNQIATLNQLNLEGLAQLFKPLIGAFLQIQAAAVDFVTNLRELESVRLIINIFNGLGQVLAVVFTAFTNLVTVILKITEPFAAAINAFDGFIEKLTGVRAIAVILGTILGVQLYQVIAGLATALIPQAIAAFNSLGVSIQLVNATSIKGFIVGIGNLIKNIATFLVNIVKTVTGNAALAASYDAVALAAGRAAAAQAVANGTPYLAGAASTVAANGAIAASAGTATTATAGLGAALAVAAPWLLVIGGAVATAALLWNDYADRTKYAKKATEGFDQDAESIRKSFEDFAASAENAGTDTEVFAEKLEKLTQKGRDRNGFEIFIDVAFATDERSAAAIRTVAEEMRKKFKGLRQGIDEARDAIKNYNKAQDESGSKGEYVKQQVQTQIALLDALIGRTITAREEELKRAASSGGGLTGNKSAEFKKLQADIERFKKQREELIKLAEEKGIELDVKFKTTGEEQVITKVSGISELIKNLEEKKATAKIGEQGAQETAQKIQGLQGLMQFIENDPVIIQVQAQFDIDKTNIESQLEYADALLNNVKSRGEVEESIFGVYKARNSYAMSTAQEELKQLKDRGASAQEIAAKERDIATLKENERKIEKAAIIDKLSRLGGEQELERDILLLKQQQQRLEASSNIIAQEGLVIAAKRAELEAQANLEKAKSTPSTEDDEAALELLKNAKAYTEIQEKALSAVKQRYGVLLSTQALERDTLLNQQAAARNNLNAQAAQMGLNSSIDKGVKSYGEMNYQASGFVQSGREAATAYIQVGEELKDAGDQAKFVGDEIRELSKDGGLDIGINADIDPQSITNAVNRGQTILDQGASQLRAPVGANVNTASFYNEVRQAAQQVQSSDATKITAQLTVNGAQTAAASIEGLSGKVGEYNDAVNNANMAQGQLNSAVQQYNLALQSGNATKILETAGAVNYQRQVVEEANYAVSITKQNLQDASEAARVLGVDIGAVGQEGLTTAQNLNEISGAVNNASTEVSDFAENTSEAFSGAADSISQAGIAAQDVGSKANEASNSLNNVGQSADAASRSVLGIAQQTGQAATAASNLEQEFSDANNAIEGSANNIQGFAAVASEDFGEFSDDLSDAFSFAEEFVDAGLGTAAEDASLSGSDFASSLGEASSQADDVYNTLSNIDDLNPTVTVSVVGLPGRFTGGPVDPGEMYRVNELGKEAFLSASGRLSMINKPKNGLWRAPSRGTVIPAHLTSQLEIPSGGVNLSSGTSSRISRATSGVSSAANLSRAMAQALRASGLLDTNNNVAVSQAGQATQLGKLTHAVNRLVDKDWNVHIDVKNPSSSSYMDLINRMS